MKRILITAYAVNPYKGSEDGTGWNMISEIATHNEVIAITRKNNQKDIERFVTENPDKKHLKNVTFAYFDLPYWMRFWKRKKKGALLYFYLWQMGIVAFIKKQNFTFDIAHNLNFHNDWIPSFLWLLQKPFLWGPVAHHPKVPKAFLTNFYGYKPYLIDRMKWSVKRLFWLVDPFLKITKNRAFKVIGVNSSVAKVLNLPENKMKVLPAVASEVVKLDDIKKQHGFHLLSIGRFVPLKGFDVTIRAFAMFYHQQEVNVRHELKLTIIGKGPYKKQLKKLTKSLKLNEAVQFVEWVPRHELEQYFKKAKAFFFPSHEGAGMVVPEALSYGLPVLCFDNIGPGEFVNQNCGRTVPYGGYNNSVSNFADVLNEWYHDKQGLEKLSQGARKQFLEKFTWARKGRVLDAIYNEMMSEKTKIGAEANMVLK